MAGFAVAVEFIVVDCSQCGMQFAITRDFYKRRLSDHETFHCPSGHGQCFRAESEIDKARKEISEIKRNYEQRNKAIDREYNYKMRYLKGVITKLKKK